MNEEDSADEELFNKGDMIVLILKDGRHYLGEFLWATDEGCALDVTAKTVFKLEQQKDAKFEAFVKGQIEQELGGLYTPNDWLKKAYSLVSDQRDRNTVSKLDLEHLKRFVNSEVEKLHTEWAKERWNEPIHDQDVSVPYMRKLTRSVRTLVLWHKIDEVCSATEMAEEAQIANWDNLVNNEEFFKLLLEKDENG